MSQTQTRKQKILGDVKKKRRQRTLTTLIVVIALIAIVVVAVFLIPRSSNPVQLPQYLSGCVNVGYFYHSHPNLTVIINGVGISLPVTYNSGCPQPIHTHDSTGVLHLEPGDNRDYKLSDWFLLWGYANSNTNYTIFNQNQIFTNRVDATHHITMTVNGSPDTTFENHTFPRNAAPTGGVGGQGLCAVATGQTCVKDNIVITYG